MDERYLLAAVLMVIGLQLGCGKMTKTENCKTGKKGDFDTMEGINITNGVHLKTYPPEYIGTGDPIRCLMACMIETDCAIAVLDSNTMKCSIYNHSISLGRPEKVAASGFISYFMSPDSKYKMVTPDGNPGPYTHAQALAECQHLGKSLPKIGLTYEELEIYLRYSGIQDDSQVGNLLIWLQGSTTTGGDVTFDDGTVVPGSQQPGNCWNTAQNSYENCVTTSPKIVTDYALVLVNPDLKLDIGLRTAGNGKPVNQVSYIVCE